jgi:hypothetical protein
MSNEWQSLDPAPAAPPNPEQALGVPKGRHRLAQRLLAFPI